MRTVTANADAGKTVTTTVTRRISGDQSQQKTGPTPDFWEYLETLPPAEWDLHIFYIYRDDPGPSMQVGKHTWQSCTNDGIPWNDREDAEAGFAAKYGGKTFRIIVKRNAERVTMGRIYINAPARQLTQGGDPIPGGGVSVMTAQPMSAADASVAVATKAIDTIAGQEREGIAIGMQMMSTASQVVRNFAQHPAPPPSQTDDLFKVMMLKMIEKMIEKMDAPPPAPTPVPVVAGAESPLISRILETALERVLNPLPSAPATSAGAELVRSLPQIGGFVAQSLHDWRLGVEAQRDGAQIMVQSQAGPVTAPPGQVMRPGPALPAQQQRQPQPPPTAAPNVEANNVPSLEFMERKIIEILAEPLSADEAAEETWGFLDRLDSRAVPQLTSLGEAGIMNLFQTRAVLRQATHNMPRLVEFIRAFLKYSEMKAAEESAAGAPPDSGQQAS